MNNTHHIVFLNRAYNDTDMHLSLAYEIAKDKDCKVSMIGYECDGYIGTPGEHEAAAYLRAQTDINFTTFLENKHAPIYLRWLHKVERYCDRLKKNSFKSPFPVNFFTKALHIATLKTVKALLQLPQPWLINAFQSWGVSCVVCDEALLQPGRSQLMDKIVRKEMGKELPTFVIQTGHYVYSKGNPTNAAPPQYKATTALNFLPSAWSREIYLQSFPQENCLHAGNLRMNPEWVTKLHDEILQPPYYDKASKMQKLPEGKIKVALMLSKLNYGVNVEALKKTITKIGHMEDVAFVIKPHTRGMKFNLMSKEELGHTIIVDDVPSPLLIEWADFQLFTGSSIVYHAMVLNKEVGLLKFCKTIGTIFDNGDMCHAFETLEQLNKFLENWRKSGAPPTSKERQKQIESLMIDEVHGGLGNKKVIQYYKKIILDNVRK